MNAQFSSPENTKFREEFMLHENLGCIHHERFTDPLRSTSTLPSSTSLSTESSTIADNRAKEPGYEMVGNHEAVPEEAREVFTFNKGKGMEEDYVEVLKL